MVDAKLQENGSADKVVESIYSNNRTIQLPKFDGEIASRVAQLILGVHIFGREKDNPPYVSHNFLQRDNTWICSSYSAVYVHGRRQDNKTSYRFWYDNQVSKLNGLDKFIVIDDFVLLANARSLNNKDKQTQEGNQASTGNRKQADTDGHIATIDDVRDDPSGVLTQFPPNDNISKIHYNNVRIYRTDDGLYTVELVGLEDLKGSEHKRYVSQLTEKGREQLNAWREGHDYKLIDNPLCTGLDLPDDFPRKLIIDLMPKDRQKCELGGKLGLGLETEERELPYPAHLRFKDMTIDYLVEQLQKM